MQKSEDQSVILQGCTGENQMRTGLVGKTSGNKERSRAAGGDSCTICEKYGKRKSAYGKSAEKRRGKGSPSGKGMACGSRDREMPLFDTRKKKWMDEAGC